MGLMEAQARADAGNRWMFEESPGELAGRLTEALRYFGDMLPAVRHVLIERSPRVLDRALSERLMQRNESLRRVLIEIYMGRWRNTELPQEMREAIGRALLPGRTE